MSAMHQALKMPQPEVLGIADMKMISTSWLIVKLPGNHGLLRRYGWLSTISKQIIATSVKINQVDQIA